MTENADRGWQCQVGRHWLPMSEPSIVVMAFAGVRMICRSHVDMMGWFDGGDPVMHWWRTATGATAQCECHP